jgi:hypothetical protein
VGEASGEGCGAVGGVVGGCVAAALALKEKAPDTGWPLAEVTRQATNVKTTAIGALCTVAWSAGLVEVSVLCADAGLAPGHTASVTAARTASSRHPARSPGLVNGRAVMSWLRGAAIRPRQLAALYGRLRRRSKP